MQGGPGVGLYREPDLKKLGGRLLVLCGSGKHGLEDGTWEWEWCPRQECKDHLHDEISLVQKHHLPCMFRCCPQKALCLLTFLAPPALCTQKRYNGIAWEVDLEPLGTHCPSGASDFEWPPEFWWTCFSQRSEVDSGNGWNTLDQKQTPAVLVWWPFWNNRKVSWNDLVQWYPNLPTYQVL